VKNNLCAQTTAAETYTPQMLIDLQQKTDVPSGYGKEPSDRKALEDLGEGKVIRMKAYLLEAHHADLGSGPRAGEMVTNGAEKCRRCAVAMASTLGTSRRLV
jgi:hypothetical protein